MNRQTRPRQQTFLVSCSSLQPLTWRLDPRDAVNEALKRPGCYLPAADGSVGTLTPPEAAN
eukprot:6454999-Karenia_brevis.AAC.1